MIFDINNKDSLYELFFLLTVNSHSELRSLLSNFLEILTVLKGIKTGYIGPKQDINLKSLDDIKDLIMENGNKIKKFIYYSKTNLIVNEKLINKMDNVDPNNLSTSMFDYKDSVVLGKLLGYPCPGINFKSHSDSYTISFNLNTSKMFRQLFNYTDKFTIQITGFRCDNVNENLEFNLHLYKEQLDYYFNTILNFGQVLLFQQTNTS